jgi:FkbM family methyltransferase
MEVLNTRYGKLIAHKNDRYLGKSLFEYGEFSEGEVELFREFINKDSIVCDVGANIGAHTLVFSRLAKQVYAFEPVPLTFNALAGMVALNDLDNVTCVQGGISDIEGVMSFQSLVTNFENNFGAAQLSTFNGTNPVQVFPLNIPCDFLKIDVEGMELQVLKGAREVIQQCRPVIYVEADRQDDRTSKLVLLLTEYGYDLNWHTPPLFNPNNYKKNPINVFGDLKSLNLLCIPREK